MNIVVDEFVVFVGVFEEEIGDCEICFEYLCWDVLFWFVYLGDSY